MSYALDPSLRRPPSDHRRRRRGRLDEIAEELLEATSLRGREVRDVTIEHIVVDIELGERQDDDD
jgi:hypothetical protein